MPPLLTDRWALENCRCSSDNTHNFSLALARRDSFRRPRMTARLAGTRWRAMARPPHRCLEGGSLFCPHCLLIIHQRPQLLVKSRVRPCCLTSANVSPRLHVQRPAEAGDLACVARLPSRERGAGEGAGTTHWVGTAVQIRPSLEVRCFVDGFLMILARRQPHCTASPGRWEKLMSSCDVPEEGVGVWWVRNKSLFSFSVSFDIKIKF